MAKKKTKANKKLKLSSSEEFEVMKLVLDKFLWLGFAIMGYGLYTSLAKGFEIGVYFVLSGAIILLLLAYLIVKEFELIR